MIRITARKAMDLRIEYIQKANLPIEDLLRGLEELNGFVFIL